MVYIITSKTRSRIMRQPKERAKLMSDRRNKSIDKHGVHQVNSISELTELEIHESMDQQGSGIKESMEATRESNAEKTKKKNKAEESKRKKIIKERVENYEERDRKKGLLQKAEKTRAKNRRRK